MIPKSTRLSLLSLIFITFLSFLNNKLSAQVTSLTENFDAVLPSGWVAVNHSTNGGSGKSWDQGDTRKFDAYTGVGNSYAIADYHSVGKGGTGTISNWLITPELNFANGGAISFYTRTATGSQFPDRLEVRLSTNGSSTNVGSTSGDVGDFTTVLVEINKDLQTGGYPEDWTQFTANIPKGGTGRIAFRYYVTDGGSGGTNSNVIGVDEFSYESVLPVALLNFNGQIKDDKAVLTWSTANEINNKGFEVEVSRDNKTFSSIGFVAAAKSAGGLNNYSFTDNKIVSGTNYYRLKQIDNDGGYRYSIVVKLNLQKFAWTILGSASSNASIQLQTDLQYNVAVQVVSLKGQLIQTINKGNLSQGTYTIPLNLNTASHGIYVVRLLVDGNSYTTKIMR